MDLAAQTGPYYFITLCISFLLRSATTCFKKVRVLLAEFMNRPLTRRRCFWLKVHWLASLSMQLLTACRKRILRSHLPASTADYVLPPGSNSRSKRVCPLSNNNQCQSARVLLTVLQMQMYDISLTAH